jgi:hypothetical protein
MAQWFGPIEEKIINWRKWRNTIPNDLNDALPLIKNFWMDAPWSKTGELSNDVKFWPTPWTIFDRISYSDSVKTLGMFYTCCLHPFIRSFNPRLHDVYDVNGDRILAVSIVYTIDDELIYHCISSNKSVKNLNTLIKDCQQSNLYTAEDFRTLG